MIPNIHTATTNKVHRVVTCFILSQLQNNAQHGCPPKIAIFHRVETMPTFANFWACISGTIEHTDVTPLDAAQRELQEETNVTQRVCEHGGLYVNVPYISQRTQEERLIRVYPFVMHIPPSTAKLELRGTEHDAYKFVTLQELETMQDSCCVPGLVEAFHHATYGQYDTSISDKVKQWANDKENGASIMTLNALQLLQQQQQQQQQEHQQQEQQGEEQSDKDDTMVMAKQIAMLRPSMVPIVNVMNEIIQTKNPKAITIESFQMDVQQAVQIGQTALEELVQAYRKRKASSDKQQEERPFTIATFSRSGTLVQILKPFVNDDDCRILCGRSTPGNEGELMAQDLTNATCISDEVLEEQLRDSSSGGGGIDVLLIGSDCIFQNGIVNKIGTERLCKAAAASSSQDGGISVYCCAGRWKVWDDMYPPPLEKDIFEIVPMKLITKLIVPGLDSCVLK